MRLTKHATPTGPRWALDGRWLAADFTLSDALGQRADALASYLAASRTDEAAQGALLAPVDPGHEVWASGVTYQRSRDARVVESQSRDVYTAVYDAERPELFFKSVGWRARGSGEAVRIRADSHWNVPESELVLVINARAEIVGYTAGNDLSSRDIEGVNPLYIPQAKLYDGSCALGPAIELCGPETMGAVPIARRIERGGAAVFEGETSTAQMKRTPSELARWLCAELSFPTGVLLFTGTGLVPPDEFTLQPGDAVRVQVGELVLENIVSS